MIKPWNVIKTRKNGKNFTGKISQDGFELYLRTSYRNSFRPKIFGKVNATSHGTQINVRLSYDLESTIALVIFPVIGFFIGRDSIIRFLIPIEVSNNTIGLICALGVFCFLYLVIWIFFKPESNKSIQELEKTFSSFQEYPKDEKLF